MRVVQIGAGAMGRTWLRAIAAAPDVELAAIVEPVAEQRNWAQRELGLADADCLATLEEATARSDWQAAVVVTPPATHRPVTEALLWNGRDVLVEKPLAVTLADAEALVDIARERGRILMVAQNYRYRSAVRALQRTIAGGDIGTIRAIDIIFHRDTRTTFGEGNFRYTMEHPLIVDMAIHHFDLLRAITGDDVSRLYGRSWHVPNGVYEHHAAAALIMTMSSGATATYSGNWAGFGDDTSWSGAWEITGDRGRLRWSGDDDAASVELLPFDGPARAAALADAAPRNQAGLLADFVRAIESRQPPETSAADNIRSLEIVLAAVASSATGDVVTLSRPVPMAAI